MLPWVLCGVLLLISIYLLMRLILLHRSLDELRDYFTQTVEEESNVLISLSSRDPYIRKCGNCASSATVI